MTIVSKNGKKSGNNGKEKNAFSNPPQVCGCRQKQYIVYEKC